MPLPTRITLPPSGRSVGGLLDSAGALPQVEWWRGVTFASGQCIPPQAVGTCTDGDVTKDMQNLSDTQVFDAFGVVEALQCSTLSNSDLMAFASQSLDVTREFAVAREFLAGAASGNPSLGDASELGAAADPIAALACLEGVAAEALSGRLAFIHVPPGVATYLKSGFAIETFDNGRTYWTASGNKVVISAGYDGREPGQGHPASGEPLFLYATGQVYAAFGMRDELPFGPSTERSQNTAHAIVEDAAIVVFDPCFVVAIDSGVNSCGGIS